MKRIILSTIISVLITLTSFSQAPEGFKYQAVVRDASNTILNNQVIGMRLSIQQGMIGGTAVYTETFIPTSNTFGLVNLEIGTGTTTDDFSTIDWANGPYFMETAIDVTGGTTYSVMGTSQLMSVPYALYAKTSGSSIPGPQGPQGIQGNTGNNGVDGVDGAVGAMGPQGIQGIAGNDGADGAMGPQGIQGIAGNNGVDGAMGPQGIQGVVGNDGADGAVGATGPQGIQGVAGNDGVGIAQTISQSGSTITLSDGGGSVNIDDADSDPLNEMQELTLNGNDLTISDGNTITLPIEPFNASPIFQSVYIDADGNGAGAPVLVLPEVPIAYTQLYSSLSMTFPADSWGNFNMQGQDYSNGITFSGGGNVLFSKVGIYQVTVNIGEIGTGTAQWAVFRLLKSGGAVAGASGSFRINPTNGAITKTFIVQVDSNSVVYSLQMFCLGSGMTAFGTTVAGSASNKVQIIQIR